ncbi:unnamed protein product [Gemmataceae bacterium]|nr:unnamed protein product [Gemmataceae bacterium]VTU02545.1 unnamed protein product [Gemmataceae bacterium]
MILLRRLRLVERTADQHRAPEPRTSVCDRIDELPAAFLIDPPTFAAAVEAGILAVVERQIRAEERLKNPSEVRP